MVSEEQHGVVFPADESGQRSTTAVGRAVLADALAPVDAVGSRAAAQETGWRSSYLVHFRRALEAGLGSRPDALAIADAGLMSLHDRMTVRVDGDERPIGEWFRQAQPTKPALEQLEVHGTGEAERELTLPYHGERLRGEGVRRRVEAWVTEGIAEPSLAEAVDAVLANPDWLRLEGQTVAVLGAAAEMGPLPSLLRWGARVAAVDLARPAIWDRVLKQAHDGAGTVVVPHPAGAPGQPGVDLLADGPAVANWLETQPGRLVVGNYVYADGATNVRVSMAVDALSRRLIGEQDDVALAFLATPTDVFAVPGEAVAQSSSRYDGRSARSRWMGRPLRTVSGGRLLRRQYVPGVAPGVNDSLVPQQGPNYALAKRLQRWRATVARDAGATVSMNVAPPTRTRSVVKNRALAAAYAGAHRFGVEVFEPATANVLMAALLVHDLHTGGGPAHDEPWQDEAFAAVHGGLWRTPYAPRSALGLAAVLGYGAARG
ncbi:MAG: hypothetical protein ABIQ59_17895 [Nocardioidaceae bacterium]